MATDLGLIGHETELPDLSPDGLSEVAALRQRTLRSLEPVVAVDDTDQTTIAALRDQLDIAERIGQTGDLARLNNLNSPLQTIRRVFDLMATSTTEDWAGIATRLNRVPQAIAGYIQSLRHAASRGHASPQRQVAAGIDQIQAMVGPGGFFATYAKGAATDDGALPEALRADVERGARAAAGAYEVLATFLRTELLPVAPATDAVGIDRYRLYSRHFLGTSIDLRETYEWGLSELREITTRMRGTAGRIAPGATVREAMAKLSSDPSRKLSGVDALRDWMQATSDAAIDALAGRHFDIPAPVRVLECRIAPTPGGTIYYTGPNEDFSRPGRMWWAVPEGVTEFTTWRELSTVYHEGVPGHHLQVAQTVYHREHLNRWRRLGSWVDGHGEGWGLYAERLMDELGFLEDPGDLLGMLDSQSFRAVRVVIDIGFHCGFAAPAEVGGGDWTYDKALRLLTSYSAKAPSRLAFELDRYLGLPGQASSYKIGERYWLRLRDEARSRSGSAFDLKAFHRNALDLGSIGLDALRAALLPDRG